MKKRRGNGQTGDLMAGPPDYLGTYFSGEKRKKEEERKVAGMLWFFFPDASRF